MAKNLGQSLQQIIDLACKFGLLVSGGMIVVIAVAISNAAVMRYVFRKPEPYSYEICVMLMVTCIVFAIPAVQQLGRNLRASYFVKYFPPAVQNLLEKIVGPVLGLFYVAMVTWQSWRAAWYSLQVCEVSQSVLRLPLFPIKFMIPIGFGLLSFVLIVQLCRGLISWGEKERESKGQI